MDPRAMADRETIKNLREALENLLGIMDSPLGRRKLPGDFSAEAIAIARKAVADSYA